MYVYIHYNYNSYFILKSVDFCFKYEKWIANIHTKVERLINKNKSLIRTYHAIE